MSTGPWWSMLHATESFSLPFLAFIRFLYNSFVRAWFQKERTSLVDLASVVQRFPHVKEIMKTNKLCIYSLYVVSHLGSGQIMSNPSVYMGKIWQNKRSWNITTFFALASRTQCPIVPDISILSAAMLKLPSCNRIASDLIKDRSCSAQLGV